MHTFIGVWEAMLEGDEGGQTQYYFSKRISRKNTPSLNRDCVYVIANALYPQHPLYENIYVQAFLDTFDRLSNLDHIKPINLASNSIKSIRLALLYGLQNGRYKAQYPHQPDVPALTFGIDILKYYYELAYQEGLQCPETLLNERTLYLTQKNRRAKAMLFSPPLNKTRQTRDTARSRSPRNFC